MLAALVINKRTESRLRLATMAVWDKARPEDLSSVSGKDSPVRLANFAGHDFGRAKQGLVPIRWAKPCIRANGSYPKTSYTAFRRD